MTKRATLHAREIQQLYRQLGLGTEKKRAAFQRQFNPVPSLPHIITDRTPRTYLSSHTKPLTSEQDDNAQLERHPE